MTYTKFLTQGTNKHLALPDSVTTLCGCVITRPDSWKRITALEGDECEKCAQHAFSACEDTAVPR